MFSLLENKKILSLSGKDRVSFLQNLLTNDITLASTSNLIYSCLLTSQGKFFCDFFIFLEKDRFLLEVSAARLDEIITKLLFYKLRSDIKIEAIDQLSIAVFDNPLLSANFEYCYYDPRFINKKIFRSYISQKELELLNKLSELDINFYQKLCISEKIPEGDIDLLCDKSMILEYGLDKLRSIDFKKGCYIGQEVIARTYYRGNIRKELVIIESNEPIKPDAKDVFLKELKVGLLGNRYLNQGLLLIKSEFKSELDQGSLILDSGQEIKTCK